MSLNNTLSVFVPVLRELLTRSRYFNSQPTGPRCAYTDRGSNCKRDNSAPTSPSLHSLPCTTKHWYHSYLKISEILAQSEASPSGTPDIQNGISLVELTHQLVLATQRGRACTENGTALYHKWKLIGPPRNVPELGEEYLAWQIAFEKKLIHGVRLIMVPKTVQPPQHRPIFCVYGCQKNDSFRWFSSHP